MTRLRRLIDSPTHLIIILGVLSIAVVASFAVALNASINSADLAHKQLQAQQHEDAKRRDAFCGLVSPIGAQPVSEKASPLSRTLIIAARHAAEVLECPNVEGG